MRRRAATVLSIAALLVPLASAAPVPPTARAAINTLLDQQMLAANAHDTDRFLSSYLHSADLVFIANGETIHGWDALRAQQLKWWKNGTSDATYHATGPVEFAVVAPDAVLVTEPLASHRTLPGGKPSDGSFVITMLWRKTREGWRVTYAHESWKR